MIHYYDVIVIGAGHAGIEAAAAAARMGCKVALITLSRSKIGHMPCNPAIGGIGKGHIVFEISALGGVMPKLCEKTYLQGNMLNKSKGPAVQGLRLQIDKIAYSKAARDLMENYPNISVIEDTADSIIRHDDGSIAGIIALSGKTYHTKSLILTTGTFLNGLVHQGLVNFSSGRRDEPAVKGLAVSIYALGLRIGRLKTGTPPRLIKESIDFSVMEEQGSHDLEFLFEFESCPLIHKESCFITRTNAQTHEVIRENAHFSPIYRGEIKGIAPRYCPSIEDKITRFAKKDSHHIFVEPESQFLNEVYPNGLSTSLPREAQEAFIRTIKGFENAIIAHPGYAIEYDFVYPDQLTHGLEVKMVSGLFLAGQINGTTGYEEAAGQGIIAGINAACRVQNRPSFVLHREESYIGVMIDDLVLFGVDEPYRMFTSRAERRLSLRQDNVFYRLSKYAHAYQLISDDKYEKVQSEFDQVSDILHRISKMKDAKAALARLFSDGDDEAVRELINHYDEEKCLNARQKEYVYAELLYAPYHEREQFEIKRALEYRELLIPEKFQFSEIPGLSIELQQKLTKFHPATIAQAALIQGMTPAALSLLVFRVREYGRIQH